VTQIVVGGAQPSGEDTRTGGFMVRKVRRAAAMRDRRPHSARRALGGAEGDRQVVGVAEGDERT
jgi:hypothetical protein